MQTDPRSTSAYDTRAEFGAPDNSAAHSLRVLLAITDDDVESAALSIAHALATRRGAAVTALSVVDPARYAAPGAVSTVLGFAEAILGPEFREQRERRLCEHIAAHLGAIQPWTVDVELGDPASCIARAAAQHRSTLIVLGLHRHTMVTRALGDDTARAVMRRVDAPVLTARPELTALPAHIIVGVDFSDASVRVACTALELLDEHGTLELVYVRSSVALGTTEDTEGTARIMADGIDAAFTWLIDALHAPASARVVRTVLDGNPADALLRHAEVAKPQLIGLGRQQHSRLSRLLIGSVTAAVFGDGRWSVLVLPPSHDAGDVRSPPEGLRSA